MYVYKIVCKANNKEYIGSTNNFERRRFEHFDSLFKGTHHNKQLQKDFIKYGTMAFHMEVIEEGFTHKEIMVAKEYIYISQSKWKYNVILQDYSKIGSNTKRTCAQKTMLKNSNKGSVIFCANEGFFEGHISRKKKNKKKAGIKMVRKFDKIVSEKTKASEGKTKYKRISKDGTEISFTVSE